MYCINCGVKLADTEKKCPLCNTLVFHPYIEQPAVRPLFPEGRMPKTKPRSKVLSGAIIIIFLIPLIVSFFSDIQTDGKLDWFGYVAGALTFTYVTVALPLWFRRPNPVIFVPCDFAVAIIYIFNIYQKTGGDWFWSFALPILGALCIITCAALTLLYYLRRGRLYVTGGTTAALGAFILLVELLLDVTFSVSFVGWSIYPLVVLMLLGGLQIYLAINRTARELVERKLFF